MSVERRANIELLRIVSMAMVITLHCLGYGGILDLYSFGETGYFLFNTLHGFCFVAVNCFVLITGYFMVSAEVKFSRSLLLIIQVESYSLLCLVLVKYFFRQPVGSGDVVKALFPLTHNQYWFATCYAVLLALMPLMNKLVKSLGQEEHLHAIKILGIIFSGLPSFLFWSRKVLGYGYEFTWFIVLYMIGAYIRKYEIKISRRKCRLIWFLFCGVGAGGAIGIDFFLYKIFGIVNVGWGQRIFFFGYNSIVFAIAAVFLFLVFAKMEVYDKLLVKISGYGRYAFGAYLLSDHDIIRRVLWENVNFADTVPGGVLFTVAKLIGIVLTIMIIGCAAEYIRVKLGNWIIRCVGKFYRKCENTL